MSAPPFPDSWYTSFVAEEHRKFKEEGSTLEFPDKNVIIKAKWDLFPKEEKLARAELRKRLRAAFIKGGGVVMTLKRRKLAGGGLSEKPKPPRVKSAFSAFQKRLAVEIKEAKRIVPFGNYAIDCGKAWRELDPVVRAEIEAETKAYNDQNLAEFHAKVVADELKRRADIETHRVETEEAKRRLTETLRERLVAEEAAHAALVAAPVPKSSPAKAVAQAERRQKRLDAAAERVAKARLDLASVSKKRARSTS